MLCRVMIRFINAECSYVNKGPRQIELTKLANLIFHVTHATNDLSQARISLFVTLHKS